MGKWCFWDGMIPFFQKRIFLIFFIYIPCGHASSKKTKTSQPRMGVNYTHLSAFHRDFFFFFSKKSWITFLPLLAPGLLHATMWDLVQCWLHHPWPPAAESSFPCGKSSLPRLTWRVGQQVGQGELLWKTGRSGYALTWPNSAGLLLLIPRGCEYCLLPLTCEVPWDVLMVVVVLLTVSAGLDGASVPSCNDDPLPQTFTGWQSPRMGEGVIGKNSQCLKIGFFAFI